MIVPHYWAEAKRKTVVGGKQYTIKRFGWSDSSEAEAEANAKQRVDAAIAEVESGKKVRRIDHKIPYNGAEGLPIREEVISHHDDAVITRNSYGALCINTPDVLFADVDFESEASSRLMWISFAILVVTAVAGGLSLLSWKMVALLAFIAALFTQTLAGAIHRATLAARGGHENIAMRAIRNFSNKHPEWNLRIYKTPMGYRVLAMHRTFDPRGDDTHAFLKEINADTNYGRMCSNQNCFRARISPKPWRIGISRMGPRPGVWPIKSEHMAARQQWVAAYEEAARNFASCKYIAHLGSESVHPKAEAIRALHDHYCRAEQNMALA